jgi:hypothetical protein
MAKLSVSMCGMYFANPVMPADLIGIVGEHYEFCVDLKVYKLRPRIPY